MLDDGEFRARTAPSISTSESVSTAHARLRELSDSTGRLTPQLVIEDAKNPDSPLHECFEWDDSKAANSHRMAQARRLIRSFTTRVHVEDLGTYITVPEFIRDPSVDKSLTGYRTLVNVRESKTDAREALEYELEHACAIVKRACSIAQGLGLAGETASIVKALDALLAKVKGN